MRILKSDYEKQLFYILADYISIKAKEEGFLSAFIFPYFDDCNVIDIIQFYDQEPKTCLAGQVQIGDIIINFINFNKNMIYGYSELENCEILYDTDDLLKNEQQRLRKQNTGITASNQLQLGVRFRVRLANLIRQRTVECNNNIIYSSIVDYYYNLLLDDKDFDFNYEACKRNIKNGYVPFLDDNLELHSECLEESLKEFNKENEKKLKL